MPRILPSLLFVLWAWAAPGHAERPRVVASLLPLHSLVSTVMQGVGEPVLLVPGNASPHDYVLRPSQARALHQATLVFRIGPALETFLDKALASLAAGTRIVDLTDAPGVTLLAPRHDDDGSTPAESEPAAAHGATDAHIWLSPANAAAMLGAIRDALSAVDPANASRYASNALHALQRLHEHERRWDARLAPVRGRPFVVFHDAYRYLEHHFGLSSIGAVLLSAERQPSAMHLRALLERMRAADVRCLFREPQFHSTLVDMIVNESGARIGVLDPLGTGVAPGADAWFQFMDANVESLATCLQRP